MTTSEIIRMAQLRRADAITMIYHAKTGHTGGTLSSMDILCALFYSAMRLDPANPGWEQRDRFLLSKGHSVEGYYAILADLGFFPKGELKTYSQAGSPLIGHPNNKVPGVELCTGALGHGLSAGVGVALGAKRLKSPSRAFVLMGDGELAEGSVWEAAMAAAHYKLDNLFAVIDRNGLQISGRTEDVMAHRNLAAKWRDFGWCVTEIDGHDIPALIAYFANEPQQGMPNCLIAHTTKGKGLPCAENQAAWHHKVPTGDQLAQAYQALQVKGVDWL